MPEAPEIALSAQILETKLKGKILTSIEFVSGRYGPERSEPNGFSEFKSNLPMRITKVDSKGKFMWFVLRTTDLSPNKNQYVWNTFGLTGMWSFIKPKHVRAVLKFDDGDLIAYYSDMRNFGTFKFSDSSTELESKLDTLGPDVLKDESFDLSVLKKYKNPIVKVLTEQKILSGIGNYLSAEILYKARISPHRPANSLTMTELEKLAHSIKYVTKLAYVKNDIGYMINLKHEKELIVKKNYHPDIKLDESDINTGFEFNVYGRKTDPLGNKVTADKIITGRTTYWVKNLQK